MSNEQIILILREYMREYQLSYQVHAALSWCIAKLLKQEDTSGTSQPIYAETYRDTKKEAAKNKAPTPVQKSTEIQYREGCR